MHKTQKKSYFRQLKAILFLFLFTLNMFSFTILGETTSENTGEVNFSDKISTDFDESNLDIDISKIIDCPANAKDYSEIKPTRTVMQIINMKFYQWHEYEVGTEGCYYIVLEKPEQKYLTRVQSLQLLASSAQWKFQQIVSQPSNQKPFKFSQNYRTKEIVFNESQIKGRTINEVAPITMANKSMVAASRYNTNAKTHASVLIDEKGEDTAQKKNEVAQGGSGLSIPSSAEEFPILGNIANGVDERSIVSNTTVKPYNAVGFMEVSTEGGEMYRGSGCLISPYTVLTAAHVLFDGTDGGFMEEVTFVPGLDVSLDIEEPYGYQTVSEYSLFVPTEYAEEDNGTNSLALLPYDYGFMILNKPFTGITTFMPIAFNYSSSTINVVGYPASVRGKSTYAMYESIGNTLITYSDGVIEYDAYISGGNSGGPITIENNGVPSKLIGVATSTAYNNSTKKKCSLGPYLYSGNSNSFSEVLSLAPPVASSAYISGVLNVGQVLTGHYKYKDANGDAELQEATYFEWYKSNSENGVYTLIEDENSATYEVRAEDSGCYIKFSVEPCSENPPFYGSSLMSKVAGPVMGPAAPVAENVKISGAATVGGTITASYTYKDINADAESGSEYRWLAASTIGGEYVPISHATSKTITLTGLEKDKFIKFEVIPQNAAEPKRGLPSRSVAIGPITQKPVAPKATYVGIYYQKIDSQAAKATAFSGDIRDMSNESTMNVMNTTNNSAGSAGGGSSVPIVFTLDTDEEYLGIYEYDDFDGDKESGTTFRWLRSSSLTGSYAAIPGATGLTYKPTSSDVGKYIKFEVTPKTTVFPTAGAATSSDAIQAKIVEYKIGYLARMKMLNDLSEDTICRILTSSGKWENYTLSHRVEIDGKFRSIDSMELDELVSYLPVGTFVDEDDIIRCYEMVQYTISSEGLISRINFISNTGAQNITLNANTYNTKNKKFEPSGVCISMYTPIYFIDLDNKYNVIDDDILLMKPSDLKSGTAYSGKAYFTDSITHFAGGVVLDK